MYIPYSTYTRPPTYNPKSTPAGGKTIPPYGNVVRFNPMPTVFRLSPALRTAASPPARISQNPDRAVSSSCNV